MAKLRQKSSFPKQLTTVTPFSKTIAIILFILLPFIGFYIGMQYQRTLDLASASVPAAISQSK
jgi:hypothetical protein